MLPEPGSTAVLPAAASVPQRPLTGFSQHYWVSRRPSCAAQRGAWLLLQLPALSTVGEFKSSGDEPAHPPVPALIKHQARWRLLLAHSRATSAKLEARPQGCEQL